MTGTPEEDKRDLDRATWEGMGGAEPMEEDTQELITFFNTIQDTFRKRHHLVNIEETAGAVIAEMKEAEKQQIVRLAKRHFVPSVCYLHDSPVSADEDSSSFIPFAALTEGNIGAFVVTVGAGSVRAHIRHLLGNKWETLEQEETRRQLYDGHFTASTAG